MRANDDALRLRCDPPQGGAEPEPDQDAAGIGGKLEAGSDFAEAGTALDEGDLVALAGKGQGRRQAADSGADDRNRQAGHLARGDRGANRAPRRIRPGEPRRPSGKDRT